MSFSSVNFLFFVAGTILAYFLLPIKKYKWVVLLISSYIFYLFSGYRYIAFIVFTTFTTYCAGLWLRRISQKSKMKLQEKKAIWNRQEKKQYKNKIICNKRLVMAFALILNFGILAFLKYYNFFAGSLNDVFEIFGISFSAPTLNLFFPLGISFYTFQSMGYVIDVYREKVDAETNFAKLALFVSFFPQIIQGPISFYDQLSSQLYEPHRFNFTNFKYGCELVLWGLFKKLVIADRAVIAINTVVENYDNYNGTALTFSIVLYALQLYADFSGGIDIARGVAQIFGIDLVQNFKRPYFSKSINEYWRRWHITLGAWMKEYVFYSLATSGLFLKASKKMKKTKFGRTTAGAHIAKVLPTSIASLIVFIIVGIWHGSSWKYVAFGIWNGAIIMISILLKPVFDKTIKRLHINPKSFLWGFYQIFRTFIIVLVGYVFDVAPSFKQAINTFWLFFFDWRLREGYIQIRALGLTINDYIFLFGCTILLFIASILQERKSDVTIMEQIDNKPFIIRYAFVVTISLLILVFGVYGPGYSPAEFVYMQF